MSGEEEVRGWFLGSTKNRKRIHRPDCQYARRQYIWAGDLTEIELAKKIIDRGPMSFWANAGCKRCCPQLENELSAFRATCHDPYRDLA